MKVICISNKGWERLPLTIGNIYDVIEITNIPYSSSRPDDSSDKFYKVKCDNGEEKHFKLDRFRNLTLDEERQLKLENILNNIN